MDVFLTHGYFLQEDKIEQVIMRPYPPLGLLYISAFLKEQKVETMVYDSTFSSFEALKKSLVEQKPALVALYANLMTKINLIKIIRFIRSQEELSSTKIVLGGPDVTYNKENYMNAGADFLIIGEGEQTMFELSDAIKKDASVDEITGLVHWKEGEIVVNPPRVKIKQVDDLPMPDREAIELDLYLSAWKARHGSSTISLSTQRGCPYTCNWCSTAVYGQSYRRRSAKLVADEVAYLIERYAPDSLWFVDDVFTVSHKWITELHEEFTQRNIKIAFECITRAERLTDEVLEQLKEMGCSKIWICAESGSQKIIDEMDRRVDVNVVRSQIKKAREVGIGTGTFIMLGYPNETMSDINETVHHLKTSNPDHFTITVAYPIAGTSLYEQVKPKMKPLPNWEESTDRDIDFERTYSREFYTHAVRYVVNSVNAHKHWENKSFLPWAKGKTKAILSRTAMAFMR